MTAVKSTKNILLTYVTKCFIIGALMLLSLLYHYDNINLFVGIFLVVIFFDKSLFTLKNFFITYTFLLFLVVGGILGYQDNEVFMYIFSFIAGYYLLQVLPKKRQAAGSKSQIDNVSHLKLFAKKRFLVSSLIILSIMATMMVVINIYHIGLWKYFSGWQMVNKIESYTKSGYEFAFISIFQQIIDLIVIAVCLMYMNVCLSLKTRLNYKLILFVLIFIPLIEMSRSSIAVNLIILGYYKYLTGFRRPKVVRLALIFLLIFIFGTLFGGLRSNILRDKSQGSLNASDFVSFQLVGNMFVNEFSGIELYNSIKKNINALHYQYGKTIILPLLFKVLPHNIFPNKTPNTSKYVMQKLFKGYAEKGFYLAPTIFGDLYLNGGKPLVIFVAFLLGMLSARIDLMAISSRFNKIGCFILFYYYYSLMRNNLSESLFFLFFTLCVYYAANMFFDVIYSRKYLYVAGSSNSG